MTTVSVIFRALNEAKWFGQALEACKNQKLSNDMSVELILVDSGSTDDTLEIAEKHGCEIFHINKSEFTFGRSLNIGCEGATGDILVFISAHCIPVDENWLASLIEPLLSGECDYTYGGQVGLPSVTRFSEAQVFSHYYKSDSNLKQDGFFCNNANSATTRALWSKHRFDETVTGLEDMVLAKAVVSDGGQIGYVAEAAVTHIHEESLEQTNRRYFREALTMREIMPEVHFNFFDFSRCLVFGIAHDLVEAGRSKQLLKEGPGIFAFRFMQYWGTYRGHNEHRQLSRAQKEAYYYPKPQIARRSQANAGSSRQVSTTPAKADS